MADIVRIYGSSAAGKETFIRRCLKDLPKETIEYLGRTKKKIVCIQESIKYIGQFTNDPVIKKREQIIEKAKKLAEKGDLVILIKGQQVDFKSDMLNRLRKEIPKAHHKIIYLHADLDTLFKRCQTKSRWTDKLEKAGVNGVKKRLLKQLDELQKLDKFDIRALDSSTPKYKPIKFPPKVE